MPAAIPAIAGLAAAGLATTGFTVGVMGLSMMTSAVLVGAVAGAVVGGLQAAVTDGDIGKGMLYGAVGGAVGGALGGLFAPMVFGSSGTTTAVGGAVEGGAATGATGTIGGATAEFNAYALPSSADSLFGAGSAGAGLEGGLSGGAAAGGLLNGDMSKYALVTGGMKAFEGLMSKTPGETYANSEEGINAVLAQRQREAELAANTAQKNLAEGARQSDATRNLNMYAIQKPYDEAEAARNRMRETATGLTLVKKQDAAAVKNQSDIDKELANYTKVA